MKIIKLSLFVIVLSTVACSTSSSQEIANITPEELADMLNNPEVQCVDVRTDAEVDQGKIMGAKHIDIYDPAFATNIDKLDKDQPIVVYCAVGGRSAQAASQLKEMGFKQIYNLEGGMRSWKSKGYPVSAD